MKRIFKRVMSLMLSLSLCVAFFPGKAEAVADPVSELGLSEMTLNVACEPAGGNYKLTYSATLKMNDAFAEVATAVAVPALLENLRFNCYLSDNLIKDPEFDVTTAYTFDQTGHYERVGNPVMENGEIKLVYKLSSAAAGTIAGGAEAVKNALKTEMKMEAFDTVAASKVLNKSFTTNGRVEITYEGGEIPGYDKEAILAAEASCNWNGPVSGGGSGSTKPNEFEITVEKTDGNKGSVNIGTTTGSTGTGNSGKATAGDNVSVKIDDIKKGYRAVDVIITTKNGTQIHVDRNEVNEFEFEMPKGDVTIQVVYEVSATHPDDSGVSEKLNSDQHIAFMVGDDKGTFRPNANITRAEVAQIFYALLRDKNIPTTKTFDDVDPDAWYADAVNAMASLGAVKGVGDGNFEPNRNITRAEFATIAAYFANSASDKYGFKDVNENHWAYNFISAASRYGWVAGVGGNIFEPDRNITRAEAATIVNNMLGRMGDYDMIDAGHGRQFPDVDNSHWGWYEIIEATDSHTHSNDSEFVEEIWHD